MIEQNNIAYILYIQIIRYLLQEKSSPSENSAIIPVK